MANVQTLVCSRGRENSLNGAGAIVIGGDYRALGVVRSLGRRGIPVWVATNEHLVATFSRYTKSRLHWPRGQEKQLEFLLTLYKQRDLDGWALFPSDDESAVFLSRHHCTLAAHFRMTTPPWEVMKWCYDKRLTYRIADQLGVHQPRTFIPAGRDDLARLDLPFPVILKPAFKENVNRFTHAKAWRVGDRQTLLSAYDEACRLVDPGIIMVQELIPGGGEEQVSYAALCVEGHPVASMTARRARQYPIDFGRASSFVESIAVPEIEEPSRRLLNAIRFTGLVEVEYKRNPRGSYQLLDINPRVWGWHTLGARAGVDFPHLAWRAIHRESLPEVRGQSGFRWVRLMTDLRAGAVEVQRRRLSIGRYIKSFRGPLEFAIFARDDPLPALLDLPFLAWLAWRRKRRRLYTKRSDEELKTKCA
jgi:D-aspartate ligase